MSIFNVFTPLQAGLVGAVVALAAPGAQATPALEQLAEADQGAVSEPGLEFTDEVDPTAEKKWRCYDEHDYEKYGYCLVRCDDDDHHFDDDDDGWYRRVTDKMRVRGNRDFCEKRAYKYCKHRGDKVDDWCFGDRRWDDDDHHDDDDDDDNHHGD